MKQLLVCMVLVCLTSLSRGNSFWMDGRTAYDSGDFDQALLNFQALRDLSGSSPALEYNLGNTLVRLGRPDEAIAHYRRAQWLKPGDPDLAANLKRAVDLTGASMPELPLARRLSGWWGPRGWQNALLASCWLLAGFGLAARFLPRLRAAAPWVFPVLGLAALLSGLGTWASRPGQFLNEAVLHGDSVTARFGPLPDATEHFSLPGGTVVILEDTVRNWAKIRAGEESGWVPIDKLFRL